MTLALKPGIGCDLCDRISALIADFGTLQLHIPSCPGDSFYTGKTYFYGTRQPLICGEITENDNPADADDFPILYMWDTFQTSGLLFGSDIETGAPFGEASFYGFSDPCLVAAAVSALHNGSTVALPLLVNSGCGGGVELELSVP